MLKNYSDVVTRRESIEAQYGDLDVGVAHRESAWEGAGDKYEHGNTRSCECKTYRATRRTIPMTEGGQESSRDTTESGGRLIVDERNRK